MLTPRQAEWVAAFLEGEGFFGYHKNPHRGAGGGNLIATADQVQRWPLDKLVLYVGGKVYLFKMRDRGIHVWQLRGKNAAALMMTLYGLMSPKRKAQIATALACWKALAPHNRDKTHCKRGHAFTAENTILAKRRCYSDWRRCRTCDQEYHRKPARLALIAGGVSSEGA